MKYQFPHGAQDLIDEIHESQNYRMQKGIPFMKQDFKFWVKDNYDPRQPEILLNLAIMDALKREEKHKNLFSENDFLTPRDQLKIINDIMTRFRINVDKELLQKDSELIKSFLKMDNKAFYTFKSNSNLDRTLIKNHFKDKRKSKLEELIEEILANEQLERDNKKKMKRLEVELEELRYSNRN